MDVKSAIELTLNLLADCGVGSWNVEVIENFGPETPRRMGLCCYDRSTITLARSTYDGTKVYLDDDAEMLMTIREEIAHVLSRGDYEHGEGFRRALALVPNVPSRHREFRIELSKPAA